MQDIRKCLSRARFGIEHDEVRGMAFMQCHPNLRVALETTNPRAVTGTWIEDDHGSGFGAFTVHRHGSAVTCDTQQRVIRRVLEPARIENSFVVEGEQRWQPR